MRVLVSEFVTGGGLAGGTIPPGLHAEGDMMLSAVVKDLADLPGVTVVATRDARLPPADLPARVVPVEGGVDPWRVWQRLADEADALLPIAPETGGALERLSRLTEDADCTLLGSAPDAVRLTAGKRRTAAHLAAAGVPVAAAGPPTHPPPSETGWVVKPDDGAGCVNTWLCRNGDPSVAGAASDAGGATVAQVFMPGPAASLSLLCRDGDAWLLACNRQHVALRAGRFVYQGGTVCGLEAARPVLAPLAQRIVRALPGLWGYVGVDLVLAETGPVVIEINPRLTTSYVGLHRAIGANPAALILDLLSRPVAAIRRTLQSVPTAVTTDLCHV